MDYQIIEEYIDRLIADSAPDAPVWNIENIRHGKAPAWNYIDGCMMTSLYTIYKLTGNKKYLTFIDNFVDYYVFGDGTIRGYELDTYNVDNINEGRVLFDLYAETGKEKYKKAIDLLYKQLETQPRTVLGNFWHKKIYPNQVWLDGLYMAQVFYTRYETLFNGGKRYDDIVNQFKTVFANMYDKQKKALLSRLGHFERKFLERPRYGTFKELLAAFGGLVHGGVSRRDKLFRYFRTRPQSRTYNYFQTHDRGAGRVYRSRKEDVLAGRRPGRQRGQLS